MPLDLPPDAGKLWLPSQPAIIRPAEYSLLRPGAFRPASISERAAIIADLLKRKRIAPDQVKAAVFFVPVVGWNVGEPKALAYEGNIGVNGSATTVTITNFALSTPPSASRCVILAFGGRNSTRSISSVTADGNAMDSVVESPGGTSTVGIFIVHFPSGTDITFVITWSGSQNHTKGGVWCATGLSSNTKVDSEVDSGASPMALTLDTNLAGGFAVAVGQQAGSGESWSWTNATERYDNGDSGTGTLSVADAATTGASLAISGAVTGGGSNIAGAAACW